MNNARTKKKVVAEAVEPERVKVTVVIHMTSGAEFEIPFAEGTVEQLANVNHLIEGSLISNRIRNSDDLVLSALDKSTYHFHIPNIECVRVRVD